MKIGIVLHPYGEDKPAGLARIIFELAENLIAQYPEHEFILFLKKMPQTFPRFPGKNWKIEILGGGIFWLDRMRDKEKMNAYIFNTPSLPFFWRPPYSIVLALDFAYWYFCARGFKNFFLMHATYWRNRFSLARADRIIAISESTRKDLLKLFPAIHPKKVQTVYFGFRKICNIPAIAVELPYPFFLFVGVFKERKNVLNVIRAFEIFSQSHSEYFLVLAGKAEGAYAKKIRDYIRVHGLEEKIVQKGFVTDPKLSFLYQHAKGLLFPSFIEGFGFPILEAMDCGLPVITSSTSSLAEVGRDATMLVDPAKPEEIASAMKCVVEDEALRARIIEKGYLRAREFSWEKTVKECMEIIENRNIGLRV